MKRRLLIGLVVGVFLIGIASTSKAVLIEAAWTAEVSLLQGLDAVSIFGSESTISWSVVYDNGSDYYTKYYDDPSPWSQTYTIADLWSGYIYLSDATFTFTDTRITDFFALNTTTNTHKYSYQSAWPGFTANDYYRYGALLDVTAYNDSLSGSGQIRIVNADQSTQIVYLKDVTFTEAPVGDPVPEPATMLLFGTGLVGLVGSRFRKKNK